MKLIRLISRPQELVTRFIHLVLNCSVTIIAIALVPLLVLIFLRMMGGYESLAIDYLLGTAGSEVTKRLTLEFLYAILCAAFIVLIFWVVARRFVAQEKLVHAQHLISEQKVFNDAIVNLGNLESASIRLAGIASLYDLAQKKEDQRIKISDIFCSHIRAWTQQESYQDQFKEKPSNEIQYLLDLLVSADKNMPFRNIRPNLSAAYLAGAHLVDAQMKDALLKNAVLRKALLYNANLRGAHLQDSDLRGAKMTGVYLQKAHLAAAFMQQAELRHAHLEEADLGKAQLQDADLYRAQLQQSLLWQANLQGAYMWRANMEGAEMWKVKMQAAYCSESSMQGVDLDQAELQGANLSKVSLQGADLNEAQLQGAKLEEAKLHGAYAIDRSEIGKYHKRMESRKDKDTELKTAIFAGGISARQLKRIQTEIQQAEKQKWIKKSEATQLLDLLKTHRAKRSVSNYTNKQLATRFKCQTGVLSVPMMRKLMQQDSQENLLDLLSYVPPQEAKKE